MSAPDVTPPVARLHSVLIDEIAKKQPHYLDRPFTVAEIYQSLVPYRSHREAIGVQMNGDYEDALLRLLAGAGDLVVLESDSALGEIRRELESRNPNTGLFREFSDAPVRLNRATLAAHGVEDPEPGEEPVPEAAEASPPVATEEPLPSPREVNPPEAVPAESPGPSEFSILPAPEPPSTTEAVPAPSVASSFLEAEISPVAPASATAPVATQVTSPVAVPALAPTAAEVSESCRWCSEALPNRLSPVNYCPHCGKSTQTRPCGSCGAELEPEWRFCVTCGSESINGSA